VGAGAQPLDPHRRRPPIPIVPVDGRARDDALARGAGPVSAWLAAVGAGGDGDPSSPVRVIDAGAAEVLATTLAAHREAPGMSVGAVALAVDTGRELAARAAADGARIVVATAPARRDDTAARALAAILTGAAEPVPNGALGALRRAGDATTAVLCGAALGAGEHGLGCVCDGIAALAGAAVAAGIERDLRPRLIAVRPDGADPDHAALVAVLGLPTTDTRGADGLAAVLAP
jgi:nicotinate-nucleotide--dimethylbenzimidazole phosphoribosyltransferase